jgi:hypothetical protein
MYSMKSWAQPTAEEIGRLRALAARPENRAYFFDRLENTEWVAPLRESGFFSDPPDPVPAGDPGYIRFPPWPEGRYLARVAALAPDSVSRVLQETAPSDNPTVIRHLLEASAALPDEQLRELSTNVTGWIGAPFADYYADAAAAVIARLLELGDAHLGLSAAAALLAIQPDPRLAEKAAIGDSPQRPQPEAVGRVSEWEYGRVLERLLIPIVDRAEMEGVRLIASLLDDALRMSRWDEEDEPDSHSFIWRPAIEDHEQNSETSIRDVLTSALRDAALRLSSRGAGDLENVVRELEAGSLLHRRIALHVLTFSAEGSSLVNETVGDRALFDEYRIRHEYATLLRRRFEDADRPTQRRVLDWITEGPDLDAYRQRHIEPDGSPPSDEDVEGYARVWRRDWYSFIAEHIRGDDAAHYRDLVAELGEPEHPDFLWWSSGLWVGPESPVTRDDLLQWSPADVVECLRTWKPGDDSGWHFGPSREGLGQIFAEVVIERAEDYAPIADRLAELDPTYVRSFFSGLAGFLREGGSFQWEKPLELATFAVQQHFEADEEVPDRDRDPGWRWCRREVASLLRLGFADRSNRLPFRFRELAWQLIDRLTGDPNPSPEHEERYGGDNMDPYTLSINTNRGTAMHAVVEYALWTRRELEAAGDDVSHGFDAMPEVRSVLEHHLDPRVEPSLAVRSVYGRWLPWLLLLDERWLTDHVDVILPAAPERATLRNTAWSTYVAWCPPYDSTFRALRSEYEAAIERVPTGGAAGTFGRVSVDAKLGEHLVAFYWRGVADEAFVDQFFQWADDELASDVMEFVGRALYNTGGDLSDGIRERIQRLWDRRLAVITNEPEPHQLEARAFGMSFVSGKLDEEWALRALERSIDLAGAPRLGDLVVERLVDVVTSEPAAVTRILAAMLRHPEDEWDYASWRDEARTVVSRAAHHADPDVIESCAAIVDFYVSRGDLDFRNLIPRTRA